MAERVLADSTHQVKDMNANIIQSPSFLQKGITSPQAFCTGNNKRARGCTLRLLVLEMPIHWYLLPKIDSPFIFVILVSFIQAI